MLPQPLGNGGDDTASLLAALSKTSGVIDLAGATYLLAGTLELVNPNLTLSNGILRALGQGGKSRSQIRQRGGGLTLDHVEIIGANPLAGMSDGAYVTALEHQHCVELIGVSLFFAHSVHLHEAYGDLMYLTDEIGGVVNQCVHINDSLLENSGRQGVTINGVRGFLLDNSPVNNIRMSTFATEPNVANTEIGGVTIRNTHFGKRRQFFYAYSGGNQAANIHDIAVESCTGDEPFTYSGFGDVILCATH